MYYTELCIIYVLYIPRWGGNYFVEIRLSLRERLNNYNQLQIALFVQVTIFSHSVIVINYLFLFIECCKYLKCFGQNILKDVFMFNYVNSSMSLVLFLYSLRQGYQMYVILFNSWKWTRAIFSVLNQNWY